MKAPHSNGWIAEFYQVCVDIMHWLGNLTGTTYEEINIVVFLILQPMIIIFLFVYILYLRNNRVIKQ